MGPPRGSGAAAPSGRPSAGAACGGNPSWPWLPRRVVEKLGEVEVVAWLLAMYLLSKVPESGMPSLWWHTDGASVQRANR
jgi:hypothetical protein